MPERIGGRVAFSKTEAKPIARELLGALEEDMENRPLS